MLISGLNDFPILAWTVHYRFTQSKQLNDFLTYLTAGIQYQSHSWKVKVKITIHLQYLFGLQPCKRFTFHL